MALDKILTRVAAGALALTLLVGTIMGQTRTLTPAWGVLTVIIAAAVMMGLHPIGVLFGKLTARRIRQLTVGVFLVMVVLQVARLIYFPVTIYHDPFRVLQQAEVLSTGSHNWGLTHYFWRYPNNVMAAVFISGWLRLWAFLSTNVAVNVLALLLLDGFVLTLARLVVSLSRRPVARLATVALFALTPLGYTYLLQVLYTDVPILLLLTGVFLLLAKWRQGTRKQNISRGIMLLLMTAIAQLLKPNFIVVLIALLLVGAVLVVRHGSGRLLIMPVLMIGLGFAASIPARTAIQDAAGFQNNTRYELPTQSWLYMGLNPATTGGYSGHDIGRMVALKSTAARTAELRRVLPLRIRKLGLGGFLKLWVGKLTRLMNLASLNSAYNGGLRQAPAWSAETITLLTIVGAVLLRTVWIVLVLLVMPQLWRAMISGQAASRLQLLAIITAIGYVAFHTLVWEVENRYGLVLLPLLVVIITSGALGRFKHSDAAGSGVVLALMAAVAFASAGQVNQPVEVAAQRSQLSAQYGSVPLRFSGTTVLRQSVQLNMAVTEARITVPARSNSFLTLRNRHTGQSIRLHRVGRSVGTNRHLTPGCYELTVRSADGRSFRAWIAQTNNYQLAPFALRQNRREFKNRAFIFQFIN